MIQYEVVEFYYGNWGSSCGKFDNLHDAIERKQLLDEKKEDMNEYFHIVVQLPKWIDNTKRAYNFIHHSLFIWHT